MSAPVQIENEMQADLAAYLKAVGNKFAIEALIETANVVIAVAKARRYDGVWGKFLWVYDKLRACTAGKAAV